MVQELKNETPKIKRYEKTRETSGGLKKRFAISDELAKFLDIDVNTRLSRQEVTCAICVYINLKDNESRPDMLRWSYLNPGGKRNLQNPFDKKIVRPDKKLSRLLHYREYKEQVDKGKITRQVFDKNTRKYTRETVNQYSLYYSTIQSLINRHFIAD